MVHVMHKIWRQNKKCCFFAVLSIGLLLYSCKKTEYLEFQDEASVFFSYENKVTPDTLPCAAFGYTDRDTVMKIPVQLLGRISPKDRAYSCVILKDSTTAKEGSDFTLPDSFIIKANAYRDTIVLAIKNRHLPPSTDSMIIALQIVPSENFDFVLGDYKQNWRDSMTLGYFRTKPYLLKIKIDYGAEAPLFWFDPRDSAYLGSYSQKKVKHFVEQQGLDLSRVVASVRRYNYSDLNIQRFAQRFADYLREMFQKGNPVMDENGLPMQMGSLLYY